MLEQILPKDPLANHFEMFKIIGYGGMGLCYLAKNLQDQKNYALKILHPDLQDSAEALLQLKKEALFEKKFQNHPHIVHTYDLLEINGLTVKIMEIMRGMTLKQYLKTEKLNREDLINKLTEALTNALNTIHEQGIIHCDIKPANIFINEQGEIKLFDFGIARTRDESTPLNFSAFSPIYSSPRVREGLIPTDEDDFYSLNKVIEEINSNELKR